MAQVQKVVLLIALITAVVLILTPFTKASDQEYVKSDTRNNHVNTNKVSSLFTEGPRRESKFLIFPKYDNYISYVCLHLANLIYAELLSLGKFS